MEDLDLGLERRLEVADEEPRDEDREEARTVRDGGRSVDEPRERERSDRVEARRRERELPEDLALGEAADDPERKADRHLEDERLDDDPERRVRLALRARSSRS